MTQQTDMIDHLTGRRHDPGCKVKVALPAGWIATVEFGGPCECYRYSLYLRWAGGPKALWVMMNPSTATPFALDMTVAKVARISKRLGYGGVLIGNVCAYRATDQRRLLEPADPVGPRNLEAIREMAALADTIIIAHGALPGKLQRHAAATVRALRESDNSLYVLRLSAAGIPMHPLARGKNHIAETVVPLLWDSTVTIPHRLGTRR